MKTQTAEEILDKYTEWEGCIAIRTEENIVLAMEEYAQQQLKILNIPVVVGRSEQLKAFCLHGGIQMLVPTKAKDLNELIKDYIESL